METRAEFYQGEIRPLSFMVYQYGRALDMGDADIMLTVSKHQEDADPVIVKHSDNFDMTYSALGVVSVVCDHKDTVIDSGLYQGQLKIVDRITGLTKKTNPFDFIIKPSLDRFFLLEADIQVATSVSEIALDIS